VNVGFKSVNSTWSVTGRSATVAPRSRPGVSHRPHRAVYGERPPPGKEIANFFKTYRRIFRTQLHAYRASARANQWLMSRTMLWLIRSVCIVELNRTWYSALR
jgi:hypothetical protein